VFPCLFCLIFLREVEECSSYCLLEWSNQGGSNIRPHFTVDWLPLQLWFTVDWLWGTSGSSCSRPRVRLREDINDLDWARILLVCFFFCMISGLEFIGMGHNVCTFSL